ncbi:CHRD domain-containing protein [bacterium]|nr:CHRD domain-containing protein [bacterium]
MKKVTALMTSVLSVLVASGVSFGATHTYFVLLSGANEVPPNGSTGSGLLIASYDDVTNQLTWIFSYDLEDPNVATNSHFHGPAAAGFTAGAQIGLGDPGGNSAGSYSTGSPSSLTETQEGQLLAGL